METDLTIGLAPDKADWQSSAQFTARRLAANAAVEAGPQDMQLGFAHGALEPEQEAIIEEGGMIDAVGVADQGIGEAAQLDEAMPIGVVARQARDLEPQHEADVGERDFGGQPGEARSRDKAGAGESEVLIDDDDAIGGPTEFERQAHIVDRSTRDCSRPGRRWTGAGRRSPDAKDGGP